MLDDVYGDIPVADLKKLKSQSQWAEFLFGPNPKAEDYSRELEPWEANQRCLRSIKYHHKKGKGRSAKPTAQRNARNQKNDKSGTSDTT